MSLDGFMRNCSREIVYEIDRKEEIVWMRGGRDVGGKSIDLEVFE